MNTQTNRPRGNNQKIRKEILRDINSVWGTVEALEKKSKATLGETNPMTEILGFTAVHMMNASFEIEEQILENTNKLSYSSVTQLFEILNIIRWLDPKSRSETHEAYQTAVQRISSKYSVDRNTMIDLCVRRLGFVGQGSTDLSLNLVEDWLFKKGTGLSKLIKAHTYEHQYQRVNEFFNSGRVIQ